MKQYQRIGLSSAIVAAAFGSGMFALSPEQLKEPVRDDYNKRNGVMDTKNGFIKLIDDNQDGRVDYVVRNSDYFLIADERKSQWPDVPTMTAAFRNAASNVLNAQRDLEYLADKEAFEKSKN